LKNNQCGIMGIMSCSDIACVVSSSAMRLDERIYFVVVCIQIGLFVLYVIDVISHSSQLREVLLTKMTRGFFHRVKLEL
jgi:hypothetical protein